MDEMTLPDVDTERASMLENTMTARATGDVSASNSVYVALRRHFMDDLTTRALLPDFVRTCRTLDTFWPYIKGKAGNYAERRQIIGAAFTPLVDYLEGKNTTPADGVVSDKLETFDADGVHAVWAKALERRNNDPEGVVSEFGK